MHIKNAVVRVTGANLGLGRAFVNAILEAGAAKIYAAARDPDTITQRGVGPIQWDITSETDIASAAAHCTDVTVLINNAGIARGRALTEAGSAAAARAELETRFFGPLNLSVALAPVMTANGGGANMARGFDVPKADRLDVARRTLVTVAEGKEEVQADDLSRQVKQGPSDGAHLAQVD